MDDVIDRPLPNVRLGLAAVAAVASFAGGVAGWELYWRDHGAEPTIRDSEGLWAIQRRRIDDGEGHRTVLIGSSRIAFDIDLDTWERVAGDRPIQLAIDGVSPMFALEDLATDPDFTGRLIVGVAPDLFFSGFQERTGFLGYYKTETPAQRASQRLSMHLLEPHFAFLDPDFALFTVLRRQDWPGRDGVRSVMDVRKLANRTSDRNQQMWSKVSDDPDYRELARSIWSQFAGPPGEKQLAWLHKARDEQIARAAAAVAKLRARGVEVIFVRPPSAAPYRTWENRDLPRAQAWDVLLAKTGAPGIHFEDYPELQGFELPEWSHLAAKERPRFTEGLVRAIARLRALRPEPRGSADRATLETP